MSLKKYVNNAWQDTNTLKKYKDGAWQDCDIAKKYNNNAWQEVWSRTMMVKLDHVGMYDGATYTLSLRDNGYGIDYNINGVDTVTNTPHAIVFCITNLSGFYNTTVSFTYSMVVKSMYGGMYLMESDITTKLYAGNVSASHTITNTYSLNGQTKLYFLIDTYENTTNVGYLTNVYVNGVLLKFSI